MENPLPPTVRRDPPDSASDWREIVARVGDLPPMPHVAARAIALVEQPETTASELAELLARDTALTSRVLKIANSAMFSRQRKITTINQAVMTVGFKALKGIIIAASLRQMNKNFGALEQLLWENAIGTAMAATMITQRLKRRYVEEIFVVGLLHGLGQIVLSTSRETAADYGRVIAIIEADGVDFITAETGVFGFAHPLVGALVAKKWNFSAETCHVILHYRDPLSGPVERSDTEEKAAIVQLAEMTIHLAGIGSPAGYPCQRESARVLADALRLPGERDATVTDLAAETKIRFEKERHLYG
jgi:HD-like signal output (HDOD) protein